MKAKMKTKPIVAGMQMPGRMQPGEPRQLPSILWFASSKGSLPYYRAIKSQNKAWRTGERLLDNE
jgi:hypothetical protein